ncbi:PPO2 [Acrasis kona]|uniref:PPO2 n=1 Tax=Acrasis kona TaxID=1008807 RepID=A0AAW2ZJ38_9EUKA
MRTNTIAMVKRKTVPSNYSAPVKKTEEKSSTTTYGTSTPLTTNKDATFSDVKGDTGLWGKIMQLFITPEENNGEHKALIGGSRIA